MIHFKDDDTKALHDGQRVNRWVNIERVASRKLTSLAAAAAISFLIKPPGNQLKALKGDRIGQHSIRINDQWRICFKWSSSNVTDVEIVDYH